MMGASSCYPNDEAESARRAGRPLGRRGDEARIAVYMRRRELRGELADGTPPTPQTPMRNLSYGNAECGSPSAEDMTYGSVWK